MLFQQKGSLHIAGVDPKIPERGCKTFITFDITSVDSKHSRHEHIGGGGGDFFRVKLFAVIVPSRTPFSAFLTENVCKVMI